MMLFIDADNDSDTGWFGYDFVVNRRVEDDHTTTLMKYDKHSGAWIEVEQLPYRVDGNRMELTIDRRLLGLKSDTFIFDFKWADNPAAELTDPIAFIEGDAAPNRRFNYRCKFAK